MKARILTWALLLWSAAAMAQNPYVALQGASQGANGVTISEPHTVLAVDVTAQCEQIIAGPYARYAQKYIGVRASLSDKKQWSVQHATISLLAPEQLTAASLAASTTAVQSHTEAAEEFARFQPDKTSTAVLALEDAAREAANTIYSIRRHRMELITGEMGENVFGEGLKSALAEMARLEQAYLELFLGKRVVKTDTRRYVVFPEASKRQYVFCRFSAEEGLLPESDLTGEMLLLQIDPGQPVAVSEASAKERSVAKCRAAALSTCTVVASGRECARTTLPIFEYGATVYVPLNPTALK